MIRTRDAVLFVVAILFMVVGISVTLWTKGGYFSAPSAQLTVPDELPTLEGVAPGVAVMDRQANISRLREQIALDTSTITPQPDLFVASEVPDAPTQDEASAHANETPVVDECLYPDDVLPKISAWPISGVQVSILNGARAVFYQERVVGEVVPGASSTPPSENIEVLTKTLLTLPLSPQKALSASCVPSEVIGVMPSGTMMLNSNASIWRSVPADTLIGYARDGYPIYGRYDGEVDACGGYQHATGYRYSITLDRSFIIGCYFATPQSFNL